MLGAIAGSHERPETFLRYSVKCDRVMASRIETAAKKAGLSVNAFVQQHFDAILDPKASPQGQGEGGAVAFSSKAFNPLEFSRRYRVSVPAARVWAALAGHVDADGLARVSLLQLGRDAGVDGSYPQRLIAALVEAGRVEIVKNPVRGQPGTYRIKWEA
ncbi:hypothetical protein [Mesorhizobium sp. WSM2239]|uniref:Toxin-antitoxin system HicB family antitoxin n=2 Tax=unclassified Mesorhizobium TaxID=325217 RepID=A0AAU8D5B8_9HYPH